MITDPNIHQFDHHHHHGDQDRGNHPHHLIIGPELTKPSQELWHEALHHHYRLFHLSARVMIKNGGKKNGNMDVDVKHGEEEEHDDN